MGQTNPHRARPPFPWFDRENSASDLARRPSRWACSEISGRQKMRVPVQQLGFEAATFAVSAPSVNQRIRSSRRMSQPVSALSALRPPSQDVNPKDHCVHRYWTAQSGCRGMCWRFSQAFKLRVLMQFGSISGCQFNGTANTPEQSTDVSFSPLWCVAGGLSRGWALFCIRRPHALLPWRISPNARAALDDLTKRSRWQKLWKPPARCEGSRKMVSRACPKTALRAAKRKNWSFRLGGCFFPQLPLSDFFCFFFFFFFGGARGPNLTPPT